MSDIDSAIDWCIVKSRTKHTNTYNMLNTIVDLLIELKQLRGEPIDKYTDAQQKKPPNPFRRGSARWNVYEGDWEDLTPGQIAEVLDLDLNYIHGILSDIYKKTGYKVPHVSGNLKSA